MAASIALNVHGRHLSMDSMSQRAPCLDSGSRPNSGRDDCLGDRQHGKCGLMVHLKRQQCKGTFSFSAALV